MQQITGSTQPAMAVAYVRTARFALAADDSALERQRRACEGCASHLGAPIAETYIDNGVSGLAESRPGLDRLLADLAHGHIRYVIAADPSRLARSNALAGRLADRITGMGAKLVTARK